MNIEEKRDKLLGICYKIDFCCDCPIVSFNDNLGYECDFDRYSDKYIEEAYKIAFGVEVKSDEIDNSVKHGKWLICSDGYYPYCSECGNEPTRGEMTKYCAECGARMDKE